MRRLRLLVLLLVAACSPLRGCVESNFTLAQDSRLPAWFTLPNQAARAQLSVELTYWTYGKNAEFVLKNAKGTTLQVASGVSCWHPRTRYARNSDGTFRPPGGPEYVIVKADGIVDVIEHSDTPAVFRMTDDQAVIVEARESMARGECRPEH
jgi:hypothetical protein